VLRYLAPTKGPKALHEFKINPEAKLLVVPVCVPGMPLMLRMLKLVFSLSLTLQTLSGQAGLAGFSRCWHGM